MDLSRFRTPGQAAATKSDGKKDVLATPTQEEIDDVLKEICISNGLNFQKLDNQVTSTTQLEMFFSGMPRMLGLDRFVNLTCLRINGQNIRKIEGLQHLAQLKELWVSECKLKETSGMEANPSLQKLFLYSNEITKIENLGNLKRLEVLWLSDNKIPMIEGLQGLSRLRELNLANNLIEKIGHSLDCAVNLESLNLSGNRIASFKDLTNLIRLQFLQSLGLKDPQYLPNPVCLLCNYSTHILYHLPNITRLDAFDVSSKALKDLAETTVVKKKMYYNMRVKTIQRNMMDMLNRLQQQKNGLLQFPHERMRALQFCIKSVERDLEEIALGAPSPKEEVEKEKVKDEGEDGQESGTESDQEGEKEKRVDMLKAKMGAVRQRLLTWEKRLKEVEEYYEDSCSRIKSVSEQTVRRLVTELETGGNVRFEDGRSTDVWFNSCHDLILSRFCAGDYKGQGILGIKIHRITRVHNRILRTRFEEKLTAAISDKSDNASYTNKTNAFKKYLEYLFYVWDPELPGAGTDPHRVLEEGFMDAHTYQQLGRDGAIPLSNSLSLAEQHRIDFHQKVAKGRAAADSCPFRHGQLIVCKVYMGKSSPAKDSKSICKENYPEADSVFRPRKLEDPQSPKKDVVSSILNSGGPHTECDCSGRQCEWFVFDHELVMPEYVIDFEYITRQKPRSPFSVSSEGTVSSSSTENKAQSQPQQPFFPQDPQVDDDVLQMKPEITPRPRLLELTEDLILKMTKASSLPAVTMLNLHAKGLRRLKNLSSMPSLKRLVVSFNELNKLEDVAHLTNLEYLDASFNKLTSLEGVKGLSRLKTLDISWNELSNTKDDLSILRKHTPNLTSLDLRLNPWQKPDDLRLRTIGRLKSLTKLNGVTVTEAEATAALRLAAGSRISQVSLLAHSRTDQLRPRSLSLAPYAQILTQVSRNKPDRAGEQDSFWYNKVTTLNLDGQHISKLSNLEKLENLRWASFNDNDITRIEGLDSCQQLEELSLEGNCLTRLEGLSKLVRLRRLSLGSNRIVSLDGAGLDKLTQLHYLSVENNRVNSLHGLQKATALIELYVGNNNICNIREIFHLKALPNFVILDLFGNPVAQQAENYRLFIVYHLKSLKALDGVAIESSEGGIAKDTFGGRLTQDFVAEHTGHANFHELRELDLPHQAIRHVDMGKVDVFQNLRSVNLEHNNLTSFSGLIYLTNLRVLCLNHNHIESVVARPKGSQHMKPTRVTVTAAGISGIPRPGVEQYAPENFTPLMENLEVLHLGYNNISNMAALQLSRLTGLKALFLQGNEITKVEGLEGLQDLRELVLDRNKIKALAEGSFINQWNLQELHMEENRLRDLSHLSYLENLQRLYLGMNRIQEIPELEKLEGLPNLIELSVVSNPVSRRLMHRPMLVYRMPHLTIIDGIPVSPEERTKAEIYFMEQQPAMVSTGEGSLPGISPYRGQVQTGHGMIRVTNVQLNSAPDRHWSTTISYGTGGQADHDVQDSLRGPPQRRNSDRGSGGGSRVDGHQGSYQNAHLPGSRSQYPSHQVPYIPHNPRK
ncbi:leucine-rich repeat-containing protein 9-like isoform X1 [Branchiostoma floridae x Branchiostoma belcheri]